MLFSIVIPTYNRAEIISTGIQSILDQTYKDFEVIVVDDGSTDDTESVVKSFKDSRIYYFKKRNEERNIARNYGIKNARGEYVCFLDSDDFLYPNHFQHAYDFIIERKRPEVCHLNFEKKKGGTFYTSQISNTGKIDVNYMLIKENIFSCNSIFIQREVLQNIGFLNSENALVGEDHFLWLRLAARYKIHVSKTITNVVIEHEERSLNKINLQKLIIGNKEIIEALSEDSFFLKYYQSMGEYFFAFKYTFVALIANDNQEYKTAIKMLLEAVKLHKGITFNRRFVAALKNALIGMVKKSKRI